MSSTSLPTRFLVPPAGGGSSPDGTPLEYVHHILYSSIAYDAVALPRIVEAFNYTRGSVVSGAGAGAIAATSFHTNMLVPRSMPRPQTFTIARLRVLMLPLVYTTAPALADDTVGVALANDDAADDSTLYTNSVALRLTIGEKLFAEAPLWLMPGKLGVGGIAATSISNTNAASVFQRRVALHTEGRAYSFAGGVGGKLPILWHGETFTCEMICQWTTNPTMNDTKLVVVMFDGVHGRQIQ